MTTDTQRGKLSRFDCEAIDEAIVDVVGDDLRTIVEYDEHDFNVLRIRDDVVEQLGGEEAFSDLADLLHSDYRLDFTQQELYEEMYGNLGVVRAFVVLMDHATIVRFVGEETGVYVSLEAGTPIQPVMDAMKGVVESDE
ncbi:DUF7522 family protein [Halobacterium zhouii]|uniref:DUF7522 family protein n=1 Tax=Halobacterium zhouii TaxID=2902624 RepID=UPI001E5A3C39|nr:hypothetical protein [Halobacterium zhouii]